MLRFLLPGLVALAAIAPLVAIGQQQPLATALTRAQLDPAATAEWSKGSEQPAALKGGPADIVWTTDGKIEWAGTKYGAETEPGPRHLRIGFKEPIACGSVLVRGGGRLSVLKGDAAYPGKLDDDSLWLPAERLETGEVGREDYAIWVLPPGTRTRALRFTHIPDLADKDYAGWIGGVLVLQDRLANIAPQSTATTSRNELKAALITNGTDDKRWSAWESVTRDQKLEAAAQPVIGNENPEWAMLTWSQPVPLRGLCALWAGFSEAEAQVFTGPADVHPREAKPEDWQTVVARKDVDPLYPLAFGPNWFDFGKTITTRAVRLRITGVSRNGHGHLKDAPMNGRRVWLGELMALRPLGDKESLTAAILPKGTDEPHAPIAVRFRLEKPANVTLVIDDTAGKRVRNLIADTPFPAGDNVAWWDGLDDLGRDVDAARHGLYNVPGQFVTPGEYRVRGLAHSGLGLQYEFPIYTAGTPAWNTEDKTGAWLANHSPPQAAAFVPADRSPLGRSAIYLGSYVSEGTHGLVWVDLDGKKLGGMNWVGGNWTGAPFLTCDRGDSPLKDRALFTGSVWPVDRNAKPVMLELRLNAITKDGAKQIAKLSWPATRTGEKGEDLIEDELGGIAADNGLLVVSLPRRGKLLFIDAADGRVLSERDYEDPRGVAFTRTGALLVLTRDSLRLHAVHGRPAIPTLDEPKILAADLENPQGITVADDGTIYVSDHGKSHQVKSFKPDGSAKGVIGRAGPPAAGPYDPLHMNHPAGLAVDERGRLWVAEHDELPKRVSIWNGDKLEKAFYGPSEYGGGGRLDHKDPKIFFYHGMEFALDWERGGFELRRIYFRPEPDKLGVPESPHAIRGVPEQPVYVNGQRYFTNCYNSNPTGGPAVAMLWLDDDPQRSVRPVAAIGEANDWPLLGTAPFHSRWPEGIKPPGDRGKNSATFIWSDTNADQQINPEEIEMRAGPAGGVSVMPDASFVLTRFNGNAVQLVPTKWLENGASVYRFDAAQTLAKDVQRPGSSGGNQALVHPSGWTFLMNGVAPYHSHSLTGIFRGEPRWSYPSLWPGLHASHEAPIPDHPGQLIGTTRFLGGFVESPGAGPLAFVNGNMGPMYVMTADGMFVSQLFEDSRVGRPWSMPRSERGMNLRGVTTHDENFWPSVTQTPDGNVFVVDGGRTSLVRVTGIDGIRRLPEMTLQVRDSDIRAAQEWQTVREAARQRARGADTLVVAITPDAPIVDGRLDEWASGDWAAIDQRGTRAHFNSDSKPYDVRGALRVSGDRLYAAYRTGDSKLLRNSGEQPTALFKTGGALDLMLSTDRTAKARTEPQAGDLRLLVTTVGGRPSTTLYRAVVPGTPPGARVPFSSPWRTIYFDQVRDISSDVTLADDGQGNYEFSVPLAVLNWKPSKGQLFRGDLGILRGDGTRTTARVYWNNKATSITADVPSEAQLTPGLWGKLRIE